MSPVALEQRVRYLEAVIVRAAKLSCSPVECEEFLSGVLAADPQIGAGGKSPPPAADDRPVPTQPKRVDDSYIIVPPPTASPFVIEMAQPVVTEKFFDGDEIKVTFTDARGHKLTVRDSDLYKVRFVSPAASRRRPSSRTRSARKAGRASPTSHREGS